MFKQLFRFKVEPATPDGTYHTESVDQGALPALAEALPRRFWDKGDGTNRSEGVGLAVGPPSVPSRGAESGPATGTFASFEEIYRNAPVSPPKVAYNITRVAEMVSSPYLSGMSSEAKRSSILMALEAVGVRLEDLLHDAMMRLCALNEYQEAQNKELKDFEAAKNHENDLIKAELDRLNAAQMMRIQANLDQVARKEDILHRWTQLKQQEAEQIAATAAFCAPQGSGASSGVGTLTAALARFGAEAAVGKR